MKWRKQMTAMWDDEKVSRLVSVGGVEGLAAFGMYCRILDIVASQMDAKSTHCSVTYGVTRWSLLLSLRGSHVRHWLEKLAVTHLLTAEWVGTEVTVTIPKLLKYRDEYSKKSVQSPDQRTEQNTEEGEQNKPKEEPRGKPAIDASESTSSISRKNDAEVWFAEKFWPLWPVKENKPAAKKEACKVLPDDREVILAGVVSWTPRILAMDSAIHASTWLHNKRWEDEARQLVRTNGANGNGHLFAGRESATEKAIRIGNERIAKQGYL